MKNIGGNGFLWGLAAIFFASTIIAAPVKPAAKAQCYYIKQYNSRLKKSYFEKRCQKPSDLKQKVDKFLGSLTPDQNSVLQKRIKQQVNVQHSAYGISFYEPTYILPFYYTGSPDQQVYAGTTPDNQQIMAEEFKGQLSLTFPIWANIHGSTFSLGAYYTQLMYWQFYAKSQYFRETDYEPAVFLSDHFLPNWMVSAGVVHESNGRGIPMERSWNRAYMDIVLSGSNWMVSIKPWVLIFKANSSNLHNADIARYMGHERIVFAYKFYHQEVSLMARNTFESGFNRGAYEFAYQFPIYKHLSGYMQFFTGYGQSMIEYNHRTNSAGIGLALSNWI